MIKEETRLRFIDYQKAFDNIRNDLLMPIQQNARIDEKHNKRVNRYLQSKIPIQKCVRQGCITSPMLLNMYVERIFQITPENMQQGIRSMLS